METKTQNSQLTSVEMSEKDIAEIWVRSNKAVAESNPEAVLGRIWELTQTVKRLEKLNDGLKNQIRTVEIRLAREEELPGRIGNKLQPVWVSKTGSVMIVRLAVTGLFANDETRPTIIEGKLLKGANGIGVQALQDRYMFGLADGQGKTREQQRTLRNSYNVRGPLANAVMDFLKAENMQKAVGDRPEAAFFGKSQIKAEVREEVITPPDLEM